MKISFVVTAKLVCTLVLAYADCWFSDAAAQSKIVVSVLLKFKIVNMKNVEKMWENFEGYSYIFCVNESKSMRISIYFSPNISFN